METQTAKKKIPGWAKFLIVVAILGVVGLTVVGIGLRLVAGWLTSKGGRYLSEQGIEKGIEKVLEKGMEQAGIAGGKAKVDFTKEGLVVEGMQDGQKIAIRAEAKLPENFPSDIPVFQPSQPGGSLVMGPMTTATFEGGAPASQVASFYQGQLPAQGWSSVFTAPSEGTGLMATYRKENRQVTVTVAPEGETKSSFTLTYGRLDEAPPSP
jgi:hypothetical protein